MIERRRRRIALTPAVFAGFIIALVVFPCLGAGRDDDESDDEPRCHRQDDLSCTIVRETAAGVWVWTTRFRPVEANSPVWSIAVGTGVPGSPPTVKFLPSPRPKDGTTPNGAPILE